MSLAQLIVWQLGKHETVSGFVADIGESGHAHLETLSAAGN